MDVTTMPSIASLISKLSTDFPTIHFIVSPDFHWSADEKAIYYNPDSKYADALIHEMAHASLGHHNYEKDIQLIEMERDAWEYARTKLGPRYNVPISAKAIQEALDTYRDWLHARSTCPVCQATGIQTKKSQYRCVACAKEWRVNDARLCALRRYNLT